MGRRAKRMRQHTRTHLQVKEEVCAKVPRSRMPTMGRAWLGSPNTLDRGRRYAPPSSTVTDTSVRYAEQVAQEKQPKSITYSRPRSILTVQDGSTKTTFAPLVVIATSVDSSRARQHRRANGDQFFPDGRTATPTKPRGSLPEPQTINHGDPRRIRFNPSESLRIRCNSWQLAKNPLPLLRRKQHRNGRRRLRSMARYGPRSKSPSRPLRKTADLDRSTRLA